MGKLLGICVSEKKGTEKHLIQEADLIENYGIQGDAHAGAWHRQVSLLSNEKIEAFKERGADVLPGAFGENLIIDGYDFRSLPVGTRFQIGDVLLEMTQIGKECHTHCRIYHKMGECIMPTQGVFSKVLKGGHIKIGDEVTMIEKDKNAPFRVAVVTMSDKGSKGEREDLSGPVIVDMVTEFGYEVIETLIIPDDQKRIEAELIRLADGRQADLILTTGGTGFSKRDVTPEATLNVATRLAPGIAEAMRMLSMKYTKRAMLSRAASVLRNDTLIINMPGSPKAVKECLEEILDSVDHGLKILKAQDSECARK